MQDPYRHFRRGYLVGLSLFTSACPRRHPLNRPIPPIDRRFDCINKPPAHVSMLLMYVSTSMRGSMVPSVPNGVDSVARYTAGLVRSVNHSAPSVVSPGHSPCVM
eukprot:366228-Chlamydomonas_euryale.AAC.3